MIFDRTIREGDCLIWQGGVQSRGYGVVFESGRVHLAHRVAYEAARGPIGAGMTIDHLCRNKRCVNPNHLEVVTRGENVRRAAAAQTHCRHGHPLSGDNVRVAVRARGTQRECVACHKARMKAYRSRQAVTS